MRTFYLISSVCFVYIFAMNLHGVICEAAFGAPITKTTLFIAMPLLAFLAISNAKKYDKS